MPSTAQIHARAFSLVEVTLAIGLVAFAFLVVFSLMPTGLSSLQEANRQIVETEIFRTVGANLNGTPYGKLSDFPPLSYFDTEGMEAKASENPTFFVRCEVGAPISSDPTDPNRQELIEEMRRVTVRIGYLRDPGVEAAPVAGVKFSRRTFLLVNRGF